MHRLIVITVIVAFTTYHPVNAEKSLHLCYLYMGDDELLVSDCYNANKEIITKTDDKEIITKTD